MIHVTKCFFNDKINATLWKRVTYMATWSVGRKKLMKKVSWPTAKFRIILNYFKALRIEFGRSVNRN